MTGGNGTPMTCAELVEVVTEYVEGTMSPADLARFDEHLELCPWCVNYVEQMRQTIRVLGRLTEESISPQARDDLLAAFRGWRGDRRP